MTTVEQIPPSHEAIAPLGRGSSRFLGVAWDKLNRRWVVHIKQRHVGCFVDEIEAAKAYDAVAREEFGEFAALNFPTEAEQTAAAKWYGIEDACRFFGLSRAGWKNWVRAGRITCGRTVSSPNGGKRKVFTLEELQGLKEQMFGEDKLYKDGKTGVYHVPPGLLTRQEAWAKFGVEKVTWERWEKLGWIQGGERVPGGPKVYRIEDIERLVAEHGVFSPPYPDPERPGVYRVPLGGWSITRREAIIDAESLPLIEGGSCHLAGTSEGVEFVSVSHDGEHVPLRRLIMGVDSNKFHVGHANGDPLDCTRANLVVRTIHQRSWTTCKRQTINGLPCASEYKGVTWDKQTERWRAGITAFGRTRRLGRFDTEIEAAEAYDEAARELFGEHAWLNFPDEGERGRVADADDQSQRLAA